MGLMMARGRSHVRQELRLQRPVIGRLFEVFESRNVSISGRLSTPAANQQPPFSLGRFVCYCFIADYLMDSWPIIFSCDSIFLF